jgi:tetratricopeptide (TPR) repeat protein
MKIHHSKPQSILPRAKLRFFLIITITLPLILIVIFELVLRFANYGDDLSLFTRQTIRGREYFSMNPAVKGRYFNDINFSASISPDYFLAKKSPGSFRVFCLGGSTTVGYPYWYNASFSSFLRERLKNTFPNRSIEVINAGMTATNSFTVLDMAKEVIDYQPDLIIVYDGHNEFYGALGAASNESIGNSRFLVNLYLNLLKYKTFLFIRNSFNKIFTIFHEENKEISRVTLMETMSRGQYVPFGSSTYWKAYKNFEGNLHDLTELCSARSIPLILSTQVSNLKDQRPFVSAPRNDLPIEKSADLKHLAEQAHRYLDAQQFENAGLFAKQALALDSTFADAHFSLGKAYEFLHQPDSALQHFILARDYDQLRFRMNSGFNQLIIKSQQKNVIIADIEKVFKANSIDSLVGSNLITEHLHPNSKGFFLIAKEYGRLIRNNSIGFSQEEWKTGDTLMDEELWQSRSVTQLDEYIAKRRTDILTSGWPFKDQIPIVDAIPSTDTLGQIAEQTTRGYLDWKTAHNKAAKFYELRGDYRNAEMEYRTIVSQIPWSMEGYLSLARSLLLQKKYNDMAQVLHASLEVEPTIQAYRTLGDLAMNDNNPVKAISYYDKMDAFPQTTKERVQNGFVLARAYASAGRVNEAKQRTLEILRLAPDFQPAVELLITLNKN